MSRPTLLLVVAFALACARQTPAAYEFDFGPPKVPYASPLVGCYSFTWRADAGTRAAPELPPYLELTGTQDVPMDLPELVWFPRVRVPAAFPLLHGDTLYWRDWHAPGDSVLINWVWGDTVEVLQSELSADTLRGTLSHYEGATETGRWSAAGVRMSCARFRSSAP